MSPKGVGASHRRSQSSPSPLSVHSTSGVRGVTQTAVGSLSLKYDKTWSILHSPFFSVSTNMYVYRCALCMTRARYLRPLSTQSFRPPRIVHFSNIRMSSTTQLEVANQHSLVHPEGDQVITLTFASEALGMPAADGYGWAQFEFGDQIGQDNRYTIVRKLGWGMHSSTWLARDRMSVSQLPYYERTATN